MSSWLKDGRLAILEALAAACDGVDERARAEIEVRDRNNRQLLEELKVLRTRIVHMDRLQHENESLQAEIGRLRDSQDVQTFPQNERKPLTELSPNKTEAQPCASTNKVLPGILSGPDPATFKAVVAKCKELRTKYEESRKIIEDHRVLLRKSTGAIDAWAKYSDGLQSTIDELRVRLRSRPPATDRVTPAQTDEASGSTRKDVENVDVSYLRRPGPYSTCELDHPSSPSLVAISGGNSTPSSPRRDFPEPPPLLPIDGTVQRTSGGTTEESTWPATALPKTDVVDLPPHPDLSVETRPPTIKVELSSDTPVIVSTRSARKRKHGFGEFEGARRQTIKSEHSSSSGPEIVREYHHHSPAKSIDFDEEVHVPTPRKRRAIPQDRRKYADKITEETPRSKPLFPEHLTKEASDEPDKSRAPSHDLVDANPHMSSASLDFFPQLQRTGRAVMMDSSARPDIYASHLALGIKDLAEDGDAEDDNSGSIKIQCPSFKGRLNALLNSPSVKARPPIHRDGPPRVQTARSTSDRNNDAGTRLSKAPKQKFGGSMTPRGSSISVSKSSTRASLSPIPSVSRDRAPKKQSILRDDMPRGRSITREETPLRERPIESLRPEDFKPNPMYNDGLTFVYDEVVRGKDARAALSGCIDPNCCGKTFRHFAEVELKSLGSSVTMRADDVVLMERYLGDETYKLGTMTREEREEVWLKTKTRELANKFGKHRHRYSRMPTPPGFWSMDFPSTQERAEELRQAEAIRKALVSERHREAMRCEGSWLFRDEDPR